MFTTDADNQTQIEVCIYEGERYRTKDNNLLGQFTLSGITPAPKGVAQIEITFALDANGILNVTALDKATNRKNAMTIKNDTGRLTQSDVDRMIADAEKYAKEDKEQRECVQAKTDLDNYLQQLMKILEDDEELMKNKLSEDEMIKFEETVSDGLEWYEKNGELARMEYVEKKRSIEKEVKGLMNKMAAVDNSKGKKKVGGRRR